MSVHAELYLCGPFTLQETSENKHQARLARRMGLARLHSVAHLQSCSLPDLPLEQLKELDSVQVRWALYTPLCM